MAEEKEKKPKHEGGGKHEHKAAKKKKLVGIATKFHDDHTASHEHHYEGDPHPVFAGTSQDMDDLHQHMDDHAGPAMGGEEQAEAEPQGGGEPGGEPGGGGEEPA